MAFGTTDDIIKNLDNEFLSRRIWIILTCKTPSNCSSFNILKQIKTDIKLIKLKKLKLQGDLT